ncbi:MAG TPA: ABC transporter ATP-binding protein [Candidatus Omnitrophota bacterium]|nr:ABC transporter ATP-binding protein [Candidatus Omnitrophota bacterium]HPB68297.1 ABC transporter ATP-binding protein [Candidatus Omnitrophota bacterium]HQO57591.1 ABC transporter ATP-binding protein [Candidatus Omnitrophota bacterium]
MDNRNYVLTAKRVTGGYGGNPVLFDVDFGVKAGEILGIIGPNGSGKSTLLRVLSGVIVPSPGCVELNGQALSAIRMERLARELAVVSQHHPATDMTVAEFVALGRTPYWRRFQFFETPKDREAVDKALLATGTEKFRERLLSRMSGGERQLVFIARALAQQPLILLLDEPTTYLDITHQAQVLDLIRKLNKEAGITVVMILHDLNIAAEYCQRLLLLDGGRVCQLGLPEDVLTYEIIERVYKTVVLVKRNPVSLKPCVFLVPEEKRGAHA